MNDQTDGTDRTEATLTQTLHAAADRTSTNVEQSNTDGWLDIVERLNVANDAPKRAARTSRDRRLLLLAAAACLVAIGAFAVTQSPAPTVLETATAGDEASADGAVDSSDFNYVLPGEEVISTDPLVVFAAPSPQPEFDTSALGTEIQFTPVSKEEALTLKVSAIEQVWMRPIGGAAVFDPVDLNPGDTFLLRALGQDGNEIASFSDVVSS